MLLSALMATSLSSCAALFQGSSNAIISTSYSSEDEDIYAAENAYVALENALNEQINQMKANHSDYDEFQFQIDEIGHNPYQLISYLTVKYGGFTYAEVADEIQEIFREQYGLYTDIATVRFVAGSGVEARLQVERIHRRITRLRWMLLIHLCQWEPMSL